MNDKKLWVECDHPYRDGFCYEGDEPIGCRGFVEANLTSPETIEKAAKAMWNADGHFQSWEREQTYRHNLSDKYRKAAEAVLRSVEEGEK